MVRISAGRPCQNHIMVVCNAWQTEAENTFADSIRSWFLLLLEYTADAEVAVQSI